MDEIVIDFGDASTQVFHVGEASVAVPGLVAGLEAAHGRYGGSLAWAELVEPAIGLARAVRCERGAGVPAPDPRRDPPARRRRPAQCPATRASSRATSSRPSRVCATGKPWPSPSCCPSSPTTLAAYRVVEREPVRTSFLGNDVLATRAPSRGGGIVAAALDRLEHATSLADRAAAVRDAYATSPPARMAGTTHISVIDAAGNAAALSSTLGSGSGVFRAGAQLNNMLGERT